MVLTVNETEMKTESISKNSLSNYLVIILSVIYFLFVKFTSGLRSDHIALIVLVNSCFYISHFTRRFIIGMGIIIVYWIIFDSMKVWPNWAFNDVDILPLYNLEKSIFGIQNGNEILTPNEYFLNHNNAFTDIISGLFYLLWMPLPLILAFYLYYKNKNLLLRFCMAFFTVNCIGFIIYYTHPAAAPWYIELHGTVLDVNTKSYAAGLLRFDSFFGIRLFEDLYAKGSNVFAALPSLHASYPLIGLIYSMKLRNKLLSILFAIVMAGIWFSAIYLTHHYILDVIAGIGCGLLGVFFFEKVLLKTKSISKFMRRYEETITLG